MRVHIDDDVVRGVRGRDRPPRRPAVLERRVASATSPDPTSFLDAKFATRARSPSDASHERLVLRQPRARRAARRRARRARPARRAPLYRRAERIVYDDAPWIWEYHRRAVEVDAAVRHAATTPHPVWIRDYTAAWLDKAGGRVMLRFVLRRLAWTAVVAWFVVTATFALLAAIPADPMRALLGPHATPEQSIAAVRAHYCLDDGVVAQLRLLRRRVVRGDLGESYRSKRAVTADARRPRVADRAARARRARAAARDRRAARRDRRAPARSLGRSRAITIGALIGAERAGVLRRHAAARPVAFRIGWFPIGGYGDGGVADRLAHLVLPALTLAAGGVACVRARSCAPRSRRARRGLRAHRARQGRARAAP